jgi:hypothetical protein
MILSFLSPSTPLYVGGGAEGFVPYKLQTARDSLSSSRRITNLFLIYLQLPYRRFIGLLGFIIFGSWAFSNPRVPSLAGPFGMPMSLVTGLAILLCPT